MGDIGTALLMCLPEPEAKPRPKPIPPADEPELKEAGPGSIPVSDDPFEVIEI